MKLPALCYGLYRDVKKRTSKMVTQMLKGNDWIALVEAEGFLDTETTPGLIVMEGPSPLLGGEPHFQAWLLLRAFRDRALDRNVPEEVLEAVFQQALTRPWSTLGLVGHPNHCWFYPRRRFRPFLAAVREYWDIFESAGQRYTYGIQEPLELWKAPNSIQYVLGNLGLDNDEVMNLPPGGVDELITRTEQHLH